MQSFKFAKRASESDQPSLSSFADKLALQCFLVALLDRNHLLRPSKGFERQATLRQNVATICY